MLQSGDSSAVREFYICVRDCITTLMQLNYLYELGSCDVLTRATMRLPYEKRSKWNEFVRKISRLREPTLMDLRDWLRDVVDAAFGPYAVSTTPIARTQR